MDTVKHPRTGRNPGKSHHNILISLDVILQGRTWLGEAHTANDGVFHTALDLYTLVLPSNTPRSCVCCPPDDYIPM